MVRTETSFWHPYADMGSVRHSEHVMERAEDVWVWDTDGNRYLDATAGLWYANVGHGRPEIRAAVAAQMERLEACSAFFDLANPPVLELAEVARRASADAGEGLLRLRRQRRDRHRGQASSPILV